VGGFHLTLTLVSEMHKAKYLKRKDSQECHLAETEVKRPANKPVWTEATPTLRNHCP
jgi:hypothetical protein